MILFARLHGVDIKSDCELLFMAYCYSHNLITQDMLLVQVMDRDLLHIDLKKENDV